MVVNSGSKCNLLLGIYHPFHLCFHVIVLHMSVSIQGDANVRVSHQILQSFGIHTGDYASVAAVHSGEWMNRLTSDTTVVAGGVTQIVPGLIGMLVRLLGAAFLS